jgi:mycofactocin system creatininase family protein
VHLVELTSFQLAEGPPRVLLIPLGSFEQHGAHLPLDTDTRVAVAVADALAAEHEGLIVGPPLHYGASGEHQGFAGTLSIGSEALHHTIVELARSLGPEFTGLLVLSWHGGNAEAIDGAVAQLRAEGHHAGALRPTIAVGDAHAGRTETSIMLALDPASVQLERARTGNIRPLSDLMPAMRTGGLRAVTESGVLGDPVGASVNEGERLLIELVRSARDQLEHWMEVSREP